MTKQASAQFAPSEPSCATQRDHIEAHFHLRVLIDEERSMRAHLLTCQPCRQYYRRQLLLNRLIPNAPGAEQRLAKGLGLPPKTTNPGTTLWQRWSQRIRSPRPLAFSALGMAVCAVFAGATRLTTTPATLQARGASQAGVKDTPTLIIYRLNDGQQVAPVAEHISGSDELAFAYVNPTEYRRLFVFARDSVGNLHWYFPSSGTQGVRVAAHDATLHELPEAIRHTLARGSANIYGVFADESISRADLERLAAKVGLGPLPLRKHQGAQIYREVRVQEVAP